MTKKKQINRMCISDYIWPFLNKILESFVSTFSGMENVSLTIKYIFPVVQQHLYSRHFLFRQQFLIHFYEIAGLINHCGDFWYVFIFCVKSLRFHFVPQVDDKQDTRMFHVNSDNSYNYIHHRDVCHYFIQDELFYTHV